ncbi:MAG: flavodoxin family protein [Anaerosomatales bacterium]
MKVVAVNGSPRTNGNTAAMIDAAFEPMRAAGIECELISLAGQTVGGCTACMRCRKEADRRCHGRDDFGNGVIEALDAADGILLASPVYFADITPEIKAIIDRAGYVSRGNPGMFVRKPGSGIVVHRRAGAIHALDSINHFFLIGQMIVVGSSYWNLGVGGAKGEAAADEEGVRTMRTLGENMAWLLGKIGEGGA